MYPDDEKASARRSLALGMLLIPGFSACVDADTAREESVAGTQAQIIGSGVISTELPEFATTFSADGSMIYFNRTSPDRRIIHIWSSSMRNGRWAEPAPLAFSDERYRDLDPFISPDGQRLYFSSTRPIEGEEPKDYDLWYVQRTSSGWSQPANVGAPVNTGDDEIFSTVSQNGTLYYCVYDADNNATIYRSTLQAGEFREPEALVIGSSKLRLTNPTIAPDESYLLLVSDHEGNADIYVSRRSDDGSWADVKALNAEVNSSYSELAPGISPGGSSLFFTSERPGVVPAGAVEGRPPGDLYTIAISAALPFN